MPLTSEIALTQRPGRVRSTTAVQAFIRRPERRRALSHQRRTPVQRRPAAAGRLAANTGGRTNSPYLVFAKAGHRGTLKCAGQVEANSEARALEIATERLGIDRSGFWAAVAEEAMIGNEFADAESLFTPAEAKSYRLHSDFPVNKLMREKRVKP